MVRTRGVCRRSETIIPRAKHIVVYKRADTWRGMRLEDHDSGTMLYLAGLVNRSTTQYRWTVMYHVHSYLVRLSIGLHLYSSRRESLGRVGKLSRNGSSDNVDASLRKYATHDCFASKRTICTPKMHATAAVPISGQQLSLGLTRPIHQISLEYQ